MMFQFDDHELDLRQQELRRGGSVVHIEPQVFSVLALLVENQDRIVSKDELLDKVWQGRFVSEAALSSRINAARKAIGDNGEDQRLIRTYHKRGFRFVGTAVRLAAEKPMEVAEATPGDALAPHVHSRLREQLAQHGPPSVAVLPFTNVNQDSDYDYFSYGLTEDVIRLLGRHRWLTVLTRHTTAPYRRLEIEPTQVGRDLHVQYLVRGSVRKHAQEVRISVELIKAADGHQLWSEVYDVGLSDLFDIQDAMARQIAAVIEPELASAERELAVRRPPENLDAWDCYQRGFYHLWGFTTPGFAEAERLFRRAVELDPGLARAHAGLSYVHLQMAFYEDLHSRAEHIQEALEAGRTAVRLDERDSLGHCVLGRAYCLRQDYVAAIRELRSTIELNPSFAQGYFALAFALVWSGDPEEAIALIEQATELSPRDPHLWTFHLTRAYAHLSLSEYDSAERYARAATQHPNATHLAHAALVSSLGHLDRPDAALDARQVLLVLKPEYSQRTAREDLFFCAQTDFIEQFIKGLHQAGVPA
jgi:TolB-like protein/Flp pilus assembly protein TadD